MPQPSDITPGNAAPDDAALKDTSPNDAAPSRDAPRPRTTDRSRWTMNNGVRLHYLDSRPGRSGLRVPRPDPASMTPGARTPIVFVPGLSDVAAEYDWLLDAWHPRRAVVVDLRGRGASDAPAHGYRPEDHAADLAAVVAACGLARVHLVTFSRGTAYALTWALAHPESIAGLVVGDYQARHIRLAPEFPRTWMTMSWRNRPMTEIMRPHVIEGIQRDSVEAPLWDDLARLPCPIMLIRAARGILDDEALARWRTAAPGLRTETFEASGHDLFKRERDRFAQVVRDFTDLADGEAGNDHFGGVPSARPAGGREYA